jgi:glycosyltransferase involved in cell wall biosynthesis
LGRDWRWLAVSSLARDLVASTGVVRRDDVAIIGNPIAPTVVADRRTRTDELRICYLATDRPTKGFDLLAPTVTALGRENARWIVFTSPPFATNREGWRSLLALPEDLIEIRRWVDHIAEAFAECDIVFVPSRRESFNRLVAEAMSNGIAVVASDIPPHRELLGNEEAGLFFPVDDPGLAAEALRRVVRDGSLRARLGARGPGRVEQFKPESISRSLLHAYERASAPRR